MTLPLFLRPEAQDDVLAARDWYSQRREGLGEGFVVALDELLDQIAEAPQMHEVVVGEVRRGMIRRFPYVVYYRPLLDRIEILAVLHGSRNPRTWTQGRNPQ